MELIMKKWLILIIGMFLVIILFTLTVYKQIQNNKTEGYDEAIDKAMEYSSLVEVNETSTYSRNESYVVIEGIDDGGGQIYVFVPENDGEISEIEVEDGISAEDAIQIVEKDQNVSKILSTQVGIENNKPLWEITYLDDKDSLVYYYLDFKTGDYWGIRALS